MVGLLDLGPRGVDHRASRYSADGARRVRLQLGRLPGASLAARSDHDRLGHVVVRHSSDRPDDDRLASRSRLRLGRSSSCFEPQLSTRSATHSTTRAGGGSPLFRSCADVSRDSAVRVAPASACSRRCSASASSRAGWSAASSRSSTMPACPSRCCSNITAPGRGSVTLIPRDASRVAALDTLPRVTTHRYGAPWSDVDRGTRDRKLRDLACLVRAHHRRRSRHEFGGRGRKRPSPRESAEIAWCAIFDAWRPCVGWRWRGRLSGRRENGAVRSGTGLWGVTAVGVVLLVGGCGHVDTYYFFYLQLSASCSSSAAVRRPARRPTRACQRLRCRLRTRRRRRPPSSPPHLGRHVHTATSPSEPAAST